MNKLLVFFIVVLVICGNYTPAFAQGPKIGDITRFLPKGDDLNDWTPNGPQQLVYGEDLFLLINGGAEIYLKHGFKSAVAAVYKHKSGRTANLEIFEMSTPAAAREIYQYKTGGAEDNASIGQGARIDEYYLNFRFKRFLITLTGVDSGEDAMRELTALARIIEKKIKQD